jgi:phosphopantothenoylcysteine decarboxylase/phosphopantothenate--cysteine ligase
MTEPKDIFQTIETYFNELKKNQKLKALVTAGPTNEYIDPVRFITNKSSGKQGYALARSLAKRGFQTTLISGPTNLQIDDNINLIKVETADEMFKATKENLPADVAIFSAAVADFKVKKEKNEKIKKQDHLHLELEKNIDILNYVSKHNSLRPKIVIGFAAETNNVQENAQKKLIEKNCDWIIANDVSNKSIGFNSNFNEVSIFYKDKDFKNETLKIKKKSEISEEIIDRVVDQLN